MEYRKELVDFLLDLISKQKFRFCRTIKETHKNIQSEIEKNTIFLNKNCSLSERIYCIINNIHEKKMCPVCNNKELTYKNLTIGYRFNCSLKCSRFNPNTSEKYKETYKRKYGVSVDCNFKLPGYYDKLKEKLKKEYNVENISQIKAVKDKKRKTFQKNHTDPYPKWGNTWYKLQLPSGMIVKVQGYERFAIPYLLNKYDESDLLIKHCDIKEKTGDIIYYNNKKDYRYYPDIFILPENKIIEVKSKYTLFKHIDDIRLKKNACIKLNLNFDILVFNYKGENITDNEEIRKILDRI